MKYIVNKLLGLLSSLGPDFIFGGEAKNLAPPLRLAAHIANTTPAQIDSAAMRIKQWIASMPSVGVGATNTNRMPGNSQLQRLQFSKHDTDRVIAAAKRRHWSPTHVFEAAAVPAARMHGGYSSNTNYLSFGIFGLRGRCDQQYRDAISPYATVIPPVITDPSFAGAAQQLKEY
ncbi:hypothetical protein MMC30_005277 [Trapelia coarctata]|nr:hypothetical protein [Trapelia coarctata]